MESFRKMRKTAMQVLLLWLFSTSAFALQQCCEVFAGADSHHNELSQIDSNQADHHSVDDDHHATSIDSHHDDENEFCPTISADLSGIPLAIASCTSQPDKKAATIHSREEIFVQQYTSLFRPDNSIWVVNRRSTYLDTRRLRI